MNRIEKIFSQGPVFTAYLTAGDGGIQRTLSAALALIAGGVNMLEIGVPFSDPIADGPVIQRATQRALNKGTSLKEVLWLASEIRKKSEIPLILFSYFNPILVVLENNFFTRAKSAGIDGALIVDLPLEEAADYHAHCTKTGIAPIYIATPTTPLSRFKKISGQSQGFIYYACRKGTTGVRNALPEDFAEKITAFKKITSLPIIVGFGLSDRATAMQVCKYADGYVIGSLFVKALEDGISDAALTQLAQNINIGGII